MFLLLGYKHKCLWQVTCSLWAACFRILFLGMGVLKTIFSHVIKINASLKASKNMINRIKGEKDVEKLYLVTLG